MATHAGKEGTVKISANAIAEVRGFSIDVTTETTDSTTLDNTTGYRTHKPTWSAWTGTVDCYWDETDTNGQNALTAGASVTLNVYPEGDGAGDTYLTGTATVTSITRSMTIDGMVEASFGFTGNGELTVATVGA